MTTIGAVTERISTWNPAKAREPSTFQYIDLGAVDNILKAIVAPTEVVSTEAPSRARQIVATGDVLVSTVRPNLNAVAIVPPDLDGATASTGFTVLRPRDAVFGRYLFHWVRSDAFVADMVRKATGASYPAVSDRIVKESQLPLPPLDEQRRIAAILDQADSLRAKRRQSLGHLEALAQSTFYELFGRRVEPKVRLDAVIDPDDRMNYGVVQPGDDVRDGVPMIRVVDLVGGRVDRAKLKRVSPDIDRAHKRSRLRGTEILLSSVGTLGRVAIASPADVGSNVNRAITRIPITDPSLRCYVAGYLRTEVPQRYFRQEARTVAQATLNVREVAAMLIPIPPKPLQDEFLSRLNSIEANRYAFQRGVGSTEDLFVSLRARAFRGEL